MLEQLNLRVTGLLMMAVMTWSGLNAQSLTWLGNLGGYPNSGARDVSFYDPLASPNPIGPSVVGWSSSSVFYDHAFRWTPSLGMQDLNTFGGNWSSAYGISADGTTIVGDAYLNSTQFHAFRWDTTTQTLQDLGTLGGNNSVAYDTNADGSVIVGAAQLLNGNWRAFLWNGTMHNLGTLGGDSYAYGVATVGTTAYVVGAYADIINGSQAFLWDSATSTMTNITPPGFQASASKISANGQYVIGWAQSTGGPRRAVRYDRTSGTSLNLGHLGGNWAEALGTNKDGSIVVGWSQNSSGDMRAFRWTSTTGIQDLTAVYAGLLIGGSYLMRADGVSPEGRFIVGQGYDASTGSYESAFLLDTCVPNRGDVNADGCVDDADVLIILFHFGQIGEIPPGDTNCDGIVDDADLLTALFYFGSGC